MADERPNAGQMEQQDRAGETRRGDWLCGSWAHGIPGHVSARRAAAQPVPSTGLRQRVCTRALNELSGTRPEGTAQARPCTRPHTGGRGEAVGAAPHSGGTQHGGPGPAGRCPQATKILPC